MARHPRFALPGYTQHVLQHGNNRDVIFVDQEDYGFYRERLAQACKRFGCAVHAYVFMTNHVHLLMTPRTATAISQVMQALEAGPLEPTPIDLFMPLQRAVA